MKIFFSLILLILVSGCDYDLEASVEEFVFRKTAESDLIEKCAEDKACIRAVKEQIESCMEKSKWRQYLENSEEEEEEELYRFVKTFYPCFKDPDGKSYF